MIWSRSWCFPHRDVAKTKQVSTSHLITQSGVSAGHPSYLKVPPCCLTCISNHQVLGPSKRFLFPPIAGPCLFPSWSARDTQCQGQTLRFGKHSTDCSIYIFILLFIYFYYISHIIIITYYYNVININKYLLIFILFHPISGLFLPSTLLNSWKAEGSQLFLLYALTYYHTGPIFCDYRA